MKRTNLLRALVALCALAACCPATNAKEPSAKESVVFDQIVQFCLESRNASKDASSATGLKKSNAVGKYALAVNNSIIPVGRAEDFRIDDAQNVGDRGEITWWEPAISVSGNSNGGNQNAGDRDTITWWEPAISVSSNSNGGNVDMTDGSAIGSYESTVWGGEFPTISDCGCSGGFNPCPPCFANCFSCVDPCFSGCCPPKPRKHCCFLLLWLRIRLGKI